MTIQITTQSIEKHPLAYDEAELKLKIGMALTLMGSTVFY